MTRFRKTVIDYAYNKILCSSQASDLKRDPCTPSCLRTLRAKRNNHRRPNQVDFVKTIGSFVN